MVNMLFLKRFASESQQQQVLLAFQFTKGIAQT